MLFCNVTLRYIFDVYSFQVFNDRLMLEIGYFESRTVDNNETCVCSVLVARHADWLRAGSWSLAKGHVDHIWNMRCCDWLGQWEGKIVHMPRAIFGITSHIWKRAHIFNVM